MAVGRSAPRDASLWDRTRDLRMAGGRCVIAHCALAPGLLIPLRSLWGGQSLDVVAQNLQGTPNPCFYGAERIPQPGGYLGL